MSQRIVKLCLAIVTAGILSSCSSTGPNIEVRKAGSLLYKVKTTAYSHLESDSLKYGRGSASGNALKFGKVRSAAADWSVFPVGTVFRIAGQPWIYEIDDYGRALVGTKTIDLYKPTKEQMHNWGSRNVHIQILRWGSYARSMDILKDRSRHPHVRAMISNIVRKQRG